MILFKKRRYSKTINFASAQYNFLLDKCRANFQAGSTIPEYKITKKNVMLKKNTIKKGGVLDV